MAGERPRFETKPREVTVQELSERINHLEKAIQPPFPEDPPPPYPTDAPVATHGETKSHPQSSLAAFSVVSGNQAQERKQTQESIQAKVKQIKLKTNHKPAPEDTEKFFFELNKQLDEIFELVEQLKINNIPAPRPEPDLPPRHYSRSCCT